VDGLRGVLALYVVVYHITLPLDLSWAFPTALAAVVMFFGLSGYVLTRAWDGRYGSFLLRRFVRLWPVYAGSLAIGYLIADMLPDWRAFFWYPFRAPSDPSLEAVDPPVWSLYIEAWAMPFMPLIAWAGAGPRWRLAIAGLTIIALCRFSPFFIFGAPFVIGSALARYDFRDHLLESPIAQWLGRISYSLYLTHWLVLTIVWRMFVAWSGGAASPPKIGILCSPMMIGVAWLVWRFIERPSILASRHFGRRPFRTPK